MHSIGGIGYGNNPDYKKKLPKVAFLKAFSKTFSNSRG
jgi:hypothetical protein